jgi:hypothetical protein
MEAVIADRWFPGDAGQPVTINRKRALTARRPV